MKLRTIFAAVVMGGVMVMGSPPTAAPSGNIPIAVIVNKANPVGGMDSKDIKLIFKGMKKKWENGQKVFPVNMPHGSEIRTAFDKRILNFSPSEAKEYWVQQKIKARATPPTVQNSSTGIKRLVAKVPSAIGYIPADKVDDSVKVVFKITDEMGFRWDMENARIVNK